MNITRAITTAAIAACLWVTMTPAQAEDMPVVWLEQEKTQCVDNHTTTTNRTGLVTGLLPVTKNGTSGYAGKHGAIFWGPWVETSRIKGCANTRR